MKKYDTSLPTAAPHRVADPEIDDSCGGSSGLVQKRQRFGRAAGAEVARRTTDVAAQRSREMRLVVVAASFDHLARGDAVPEEHRGPPSPIDLSHRVAGEPGGRGEASLDGA